MGNAGLTNFNRVYVWEFPVRMYHWVNAICVFVLIVTGFIIGRPTTIQYADEAYQQYWFGIIRFGHFVSAFVYLFNHLVRIYWGFVGNRYARWDNFIPVKKAQIKEVVETLRVDILQTKARGTISLGHNALAGFIYFLSFLVFLFQAFSGLALYSGMSQWFFPGMFNWAVPLMGGDMSVRQWHHMGMWFFIVFIIVHVYLVFYHDYVEGRATASSMVGGWKFEREDVVRKADHH